MRQPADTGRSARREAVAVLGAAVLAAGCLVLAAGRTWAVAVQTAPGLPRAEQALPGRALAPAVFALGLAGLAGALGVLATRGWGRRLAGVLVACCGAGSAVSAGLAANPSTVLEALPAAFGTAGVRVQVTAWPVAAVVAGVLVAACGVVVVWRGTRWPGMGAKYDAPRQRDAEPDMWRAFDRGDDPTV